MSELRGFGDVVEGLKKFNGKLLAVAVDPPGTNAGVVDRFDLDFSILSDADRKTIADYGIVHKGGGPDGGDIAIPAQFLIDQSGKILWRRIAGRIQDRPAPSEVVATVAKLIPG